MNYVSFFWMEAQIAKYYGSMLAMSDTMIDQLHDAIAERDDTIAAIKAENAAMKIEIDKLKEKIDELRNYEL